MYLSLGQGFFCASQSKTLVINAENSQITFSIKHLGVLNVEGGFHDFEGEVTFQNKQLVNLKGNIRVESISTNDDSRDKMLLSEAYLDSKTYATIQFNSSEIDTPSNAISGQLIIKRETRPIQLFIQNFETETEMKLTAKISRKDFKLDFGSMNGLIGDIIKIEVFINY
nr:YceI family protein [uncultured Psychroserpens sp.]